jgi:NAD(P)-dependent dehydrogenase (short-subunit alcohol dehydrogenase family)
VLRARVPFDDTQLDALLALLDQARELDPADPRYLRLEQAVAHLVKTGKKRRKQARSQATRAADAELLSQPAPPDGQSLLRQRSCYVCKQPYRELYGGYRLLCPTCAGRSEAMRGQPLALEGRRALLTGGRVKIGYATALQMLRAGATVHVTTRFPRDAARRYAEEPDAPVWADRLHVHGLDLRELGSLLALLERLREGPPFDIVINNAAQSIWHPPEHFEALYQAEQEPLTGPVAPAPQLPARQAPLSLRRQLEALDRQRVDSWLQTLGEVAPIDMVEVHLVNAVAPFLVCSRLREHLGRSPFPDRYVVNVSAVEGQFGREHKSVRHPHTNMAKAALNMLTRTSAPELAQDGIYMVSVDPGWMSRETSRADDPTFRPPLQADDSAARILHPIAQGLAGEPLYGVLLKDFVPVSW